MSTSMPGRRIIPGWVFVVSTAALAIAGCGGATDAPGAPQEVSGSLTAALSSASLNLGQGSTQSLSLTVTRVGNVPGAVTLTVDGAPAGVSVTTNPSQLPASETSAQLTLSATTAAAIGTYGLTVRVHATGADASASLALTITPKPSLRVSVSPAIVSVPVGASVSATVSLLRTALDAPVDLAASGLPVGLSIVAQPSSVTGTTATLTIVASSAVAAGQYSVLISATPSGSAGLAASSLLAVTVPPSNSATLLTWARCTAPDWVAVRDGAGQWVHVGLTSGSIVFQTTGATGSFAYVEAGRSLVARTMSAGELAGQVFDMCPPVAVAKTIAGIDAQAPGPGGPQHNFELGGAHAEIAPGAALPSVSFSLSGVRDGIHDLVAWATGASASDKVEIIRDINLADGGSLEPVNLGRDGMNQSLNLATVTNPLSAETYTFSQYYLTTSACTMNPIGTFVQTKGASGVIHGVPGIVQRPTDFHMVSVLGIVQPVSRTATLSYHDGGNVNVALPSPIAKPDIARLVGPYMRFSAAFADLSGEFDSSVGIIVSDATNRVDISTTIAASGRSNISLAIPDFSGVAGWNNSFAIAAGASVTAIVTATGGPAGARCSEGARSVSSSLTFQF